MKFKQLKFIAAVLILSGMQTIAAAKGLVMGLIPAENNEEMIQKFEPMRQYLEAKTGEPVKVFTATDYAGVIEGMKKGRVDIAPGLGRCLMCWLKKKPMPKRLPWVYVQIPDCLPTVPYLWCRKVPRLRLSPT
ncbi:MAG: PhnD/SsuA/transferrin family substrate-binding protein [Methylobacter sp.]|nr:PhnD/SsuA/transferrin family substrate-binding protein [Methylobacter sp.]